MRVHWVVITLVLIGSCLGAQPAAEAVRWRLPDDHYVGYRIRGDLAVGHLGFFGYCLEDGRRLTTEPAHPAFLSLPLVTLLPTKPPRVGLKMKFRHTFTHFENYVPVRVKGSVRVRAVSKERMELGGSFELEDVRVQGSDPRYHAITEGKLTFTAKWDLTQGVMRYAEVKYWYKYDDRFDFSQLYTDKSIPRRRDVKVVLDHRYYFKGVTPRSEMGRRIDKWVDRTRKSMLFWWGGSPAKPQNPALNIGYEGLYVLALLHAHAPKNHAAIRKGMDLLRSGSISSTYSAALLLMALDAWYTPAEDLLRPEQDRDPSSRAKLTPEDRKRAKQAVHYLLESQTAGGWSYGGRYDLRKSFRESRDLPDNSNTQFALMGLHAAARLGVRVEARVWKRALSYWQRVERKTGYTPKGRRKPLLGWCYDTGRDRPYFSMTAGGLASLSIIAQRLGIEPGGSSRSAKKIGGLMRSGADWLTYFYSVRQCRGYARLADWQDDDWAYHLYAMERACDFGRIKKLGKRDWYHEGAMAILAETYPDDDPDYVYESLCLLFLQRSTPPAVTIATK